MRWLVTGGAGFIGCNLIKRLLAEGAQHIRILDNLSVGTRQDLACETCEIYGDGNQTRDFIYIDDLVEAVINSAIVTSLSPQSSALSPSKSPQSSALSPELSPQHSVLDFPWGEAFQIATNKEHTVNEVTDLLKELLYKKAQIDMQVAYGAQRLGDVRRNYSDTTKANKLLDWRAKTDLAQGLGQTIAWFLNS